MILQCNSDVLYRGVDSTLSDCLQRSVVGLEEGEGGALAVLQAALQDRRLPGRVESPGRGGVESDSRCKDYSGLASDV